MEHIVDLYYALEKQQLHKRMSCDQQWKVIAGFIDNCPSNKIDVVKALLREFESPSKKEYNPFDKWGWGAFAFFAAGGIVYVYTRLLHIPRQNISSYFYWIMALWCIALGCTIRKLYGLIITNSERTGWIIDHLKAMELDFENNHV